MKVQELTKTEFLKKVANYEASPNKWVYKGDKPCIVDFYATLKLPELDKLCLTWNVYKLPSFLITSIGSTE